MCNLYSITTTQQAMRQLFKVRPAWDRAGNLPPLPGVFPDYPPRSSATLRMGSGNC